MDQRTSRPATRASGSGRDRFAHQEGPANVIEAGLCGTACLWRDVRWAAGARLLLLCANAVLTPGGGKASSDRSNSTETRVPASDASRRRERSREPGEPVPVNAEAAVFRAGDREPRLCRQLRLTLTTCSVAASTSTTVPPPEQRPNNGALHGWAQVSLVSGTPDELGDMNVLWRRSGERLTKVWVERIWSRSG